MQSIDVTNKDGLDGTELDRYESVYETLTFLWGAPRTMPERSSLSEIARELFLVGADGIAIVNRTDDLLERFRDPRFVTPRSLLRHFTSGGIIGQLRTPEDVERHLASRGRLKGDGDDHV